MTRGRAIPDPAPHEALSNLSGFVGNRIYYLLKGHGSKDGRADHRRMNEPSILDQTAFETDAVRPQPLFDHLKPLDLGNKSLVGITQLRALRSRQLAQQKDVRPVVYQRAIAIPAVWVIPIPLSHGRGICRSQLRSHQNQPASGIKIHDKLEAYKLGSPSAHFNTLSIVIKAYTKLAQFFGVAFIKELAQENCSHGVAADTDSRGNLPSYELKSSRTVG
jgi:hypothetical protein